MHEHLRARSAAGLGQWNAATTSALFRRVTEYRESIPGLDDLPDPDTSPLGPAPTDPTQLAMYRLLAHELDVAADPTRTQTRGIA